MSLKDEQKIIKIAKKKNSIVKYKKTFGFIKNFFVQNYQEVKQKKL